MCNSVYFAYDFAVSRVTSFPHAFLASTLVRKVEKYILPFYKRPGQKHNFICCLKCAGQVPFINICEPRQTCGKFSQNRLLFNISYLFPYKILHLYLPEMSVWYDVPKPSTQDEKYPEWHIYVSLIYGAVDVIRNVP